MEYVLTVNCTAAACGDADACVGTEVCTTATFSKPSATTITTCVPTPTCLGVYGKHDPGVMVMSLADEASQLRVRGWESRHLLLGLLRRDQMSSDGREVAPLQRG